jgi:hypothetical protein
VELQKLQARTEPEALRRALYQAYPKIIEDPLPSQVSQSPRGDHCMRVNGDLPGVFNGIASPPLPAAALASVDSPPIEPEKKPIQFPSGDQAGTICCPLAPDVSGTGGPPATLANQILYCPLETRTKAILWPSGEKRTSLTRSVSPSANLSRVSKGRSHPSCGLRQPDLVGAAAVPGIRKLMT